MKTYLFHICLALLIPNLLEAQSKYFYKIYDNGTFQGFTKAKQTNENYIILGAFVAPETPWSIMLYNMNNYCDSIWKKEIIIPEGEIVSGDFVITETGYVLVGNKTLLWEDNQTIAYQAHVTTTDMQGNLVGIIPLNNLPSTALGIMKTQNGGYLAVGSIVPDYPSNPPYYTKLYAVKLNAQLGIEWERVYDDSIIFNNYFSDILPAPDGSGYYLLGTINWGPVAMNSGDILLMKIDFYGDILEYYSINISGMDQTLSFNLTPDNHFLISGAIQGETGYIRGIVLKTDLQANIIWQNNLFPSPTEGEIASLIIATDGNYVGGGSYKSSSGKTDAYLVKLNALTGDVLWERYYGGAYRDYCYDMIATTDGGYLMVGRQDTASGAYAYIVKTNCMGLLTEPQAAFTFATDSVALSATFYNQSQYVYPDSIDGGHFIWHFDDGSPPFQTKNPHPFTYPYNQPGTYYVTLQAIVCNDTAVFQTIVKPQSGWGTAVGIQTPLASEGGSYGVVVYPNPAQNLLHFTLQNSLTPPLGGWGVSLFTPTGHRVLYSAVSPASASASIEIGHLPVGMYFYTVSVADVAGVPNGTVIARGKVAVVR